MEAGEEVLVGVGRQGRVAGRAVPEPALHGEEVVGAERSLRVRDAVVEVPAGEVQGEVVDRRDVGDDVLEDLIGEGFDGGDHFR